MGKKMKVCDFEDDLEGLQGAISVFVKNDELDVLLESGFRLMRKAAEELKPALHAIGMVERVNDGLALAELLVREGKYKDAEDAVLFMNRELMEASGTMEKLRRRYKR